MSNPMRKLAAILVAGALVLTGCSRGGGEQAGPGNSAANHPKGERIAALGLGDADTLLALGKKPVAVAPWGAKGDGSTDETGLGPWSRQMMGDAKPATIYNTGQGFTADIIEKVTAANPDQIVAVNAAVDDQAKKALNGIAPTTVKPEGFTDWQVPWQEQVKAISSAVGEEQQGQDLIRKTDDAFAKFREAHPDLKDQKAAVVMPYEGKIGLYTSGDGRGQFIQNLGFKIPKKLEGDGKTFYRDIAPENYADLNDVDYLFVFDYAGAADGLKKDPTFAGLDVVKSGKVRYLSQDTGNAMSMPNPVTIPWAVDQFEKQL